MLLLRALSDTPQVAETRSTCLHAFGAGGFVACYIFQAARAGPRVKYIAGGHYCTCHDMNYTMNDLSFSGVFLPLSLGSAETKVPLQKSGK